MSCKPSTHDNSRQSAVFQSNLSYSRPIPAMVGSYCQPCENGLLETFLTVYSVSLVIMKLVCFIRTLITNSNCITLPVQTNMCNMLQKREHCIVCIM